MQDENNSDEFLDCDLSDDDPGKRIETFNKRYSPRSTTEMKKTLS